MSSHLALKNLLRPNMGSIHGLSYSDGLTGMELKVGWLWKEIFMKSPPEKRIRILKRSNIRFWVKDNYAKDAKSDVVEKFESVLPRAFLVNVGRKGQAPYVLNSYYDPAFDPLKEALLDEEVTWLRKDDFSGQVERIDYSPNRVFIKTNQNGEGMLVLLDNYFPGWSVKVDGRSGYIYRANYFYRRVKLKAGQHIVEFFYLPEGF